MSPRMPCPLAAGGEEQASYSARRHSCSSLTPRVTSSPQDTWWERVVQALVHHIPFIPPPCSCVRRVGGAQRGSRTSLASVPSRVLGCPDLSNIPGQAEASVLSVNPWKEGATPGRGPLSWGKGSAADQAVKGQPRSQTAAKLTTASAGTEAPPVCWMDVEPWVTVWVCPLMTHVGCFLKTKKPSGGHSSSRASAEMQPMW
ncbi:hypothetical protein J1605_015677 [Eschrichtius robustus]|uniref:Uncharacterized protein n=1 Tax=Eschrichtius robustus TaxID=9764 RepID=A0AB34GA52_ESCRO|nr:hypothetical protein J1605_015677 [Eschrichtius robustus]